MRHNAVSIRFLIVLMVVGALAAFTLATSDPAAGHSAPSAGERHYDLDDGRYMAIVPADTYNQESYIDTYVDSISPGTDHCTDSQLAVGYNVDEFGTRYRRAYLGFHLSSIPSDAVVTSATFYAYLYNAGGDSSVSIALRRVTSSWGCPRTWNNKPSSTAYVSRSISSSSGWKSWPVTSLVQNYWIGRNFGTSPNFGLELRGPESGGASRYHWRYFRSKNAGSSHPYLVVIYQLPSPTPTRTRTPTRTSTPTPTLTPTPTRTPTPSRECAFPLVVNNADDVDDEACDGAHCSLREAILCANSHRGPDVISFDIPDTDTGFTGSVWLIAPHSALPELTDAGTTIDGPSQAANRGDTNAAGPEIVLSGASAGAANGLYIRASNCEVRGLDIGGFELSGVLVSGTGASNNTIADNYIGVAANGTAGFGNDRHGVEIVGSARSTQLNGNVISGNNLAGIWVGGTGSEQQNVISENRIGTNADGTAAIPNRQGGVQIMHGAHHNTIGPDNVISGNGGGGFGNGVSIGAGSDRNTVIGNRIGTDAGGTAALPNGRHGVDVAGSEQIVVEGNLLSGNTYSGIKMYGGGNNQVRGNIIGLNADGTGAVPNRSEGFIIEDGATNITVGGATASERNVISGNGGNGIGIKDPETGHITILGNYIGTDAAGSGAIPNGANGIQLFDRVHDNMIGPGNIIANNTGHGLYLFDGTHTNVIGPDNVIANNGGDGVRVDGQDTLYNTITQNSIYDDVGLGIENINGGNTELPPPAFTDFTVTEASGTATLPGGAPCAGCTIEVFSDDGWEGRQYLGSGTTLADGSWTVTFAAAPTYGGLTATSTDTAGNTSEFSSPPVSFLWPDVEVVKELIEPPGGMAGVGEDVAFRITIRNTGTATLTAIQVTDAYPSECLLFTGSDPMPDTVDPVVGELTWDDITTHFGNLEPEEEISFTLHFRVFSATCDLGPLAVNCTHVEAQDSIAHVVEAHWCDDVTLEPGPPAIDVIKEPEDPVVCVDDPVRFWANITNTGPVPITDVRLTDIYDTTYLESLNDPAFWGPDDGELTHRFDLSAWPMGPGSILGGLLEFQARAETSSTVDELRAVANDDPATEQSDTAEVEILPEPGPCEGNLVVNGGFEEGWAGWEAGLGAPRVEPPGHSGASSLRLGILPGVDMARTDIAYQDVTIPADAHDASLSFWYNVDNDGDDDRRFNSFVAHVIDHVTGASHRVMDSVDTGGWQPATFDLTPFVGQTVRILFGATNDGDGTGPLWAYVDDVEICTSHCGPPAPPPDGPPGPPPRPGPDQPPLTCWYWKAGWPDYAPNGVPDFDQKRPAVETAPTIAKSPFGDSESNRRRPVSQGLPRIYSPGAHQTDVFTPTVDGPAAAANSLWWYDSHFEPGNTPPPAISDGYPLVEAFGAWDDHDSQNVPPFIRDLAERMHTDGYPDDPGDWIGTRPGELAAGIRDLLAEKELAEDYSVTLERDPAYDLVRDEVLHSEDVLLLLGFWEYQPDGWRRLGGHWVTAAGVDCMEGRRIGINDPFIDSAEAGYAGVYRPMAGHAQPHDQRVHDDAAYVSHDVYNTVDGTHGLELVNYVRWDPVTETFYPDIFRFWTANTPSEMEEDQADEYQGGPIRVYAEYMAAVSPVADTVTLSLVPGSVEASVGEVVAVDVVAESRTQPFDTVQVYLDFDPTLLQVVDEAGSPVTAITPGNLTMVLQNEVDNEAGQVNYAARVPLGGPPVTGRVPVARVYLQAIAGTPPEGAALAFSWTTPRRTDVLSGTESVLGRIEEARVRAGDPATIHASVALEGRPAPPHAQWEIPLTVELRDPASDATLRIFDVHTDNQGRFSIDGVTPGTYDLRVKGMHTLANRRPDVALASGENTVDMGRLLEGDADNDNDVDGADASLVNRAFGSVPGDVHWDPRTDFNADDLVDGVDMGLLAANFGRAGDIELTKTQDARRKTFSTPHPNPLQTRSRLRATPPVTITFATVPSAVQVNDVFEVDVVIHAGVQPVDTAEVYIYFPSAALQVVDGAGLPADSVQGGSVFDMELANRVDNSAGTIHYAATMLGSSLTGDITVATIRFKAIGLTGQDWLRFQVWPPEKTDVTYRGQSVLTAWPAAPVTVRGPVTVYLPVVLRERHGGVAGLWR